MSRKVYGLLRGRVQHAVLTGMLALAIGVGGGGKVLAQTPDPSIADLTQAAVKEGHVTWYGSQISTPHMELVKKAFEAAYPGVEVSLVNGTSSTLFGRLSQDQQMGVARADVYSSADPTQFVGLAHDGKLAHFTPPNLATIDPAYRSFGEAGVFYPTLGGLLGIIYNTKQVSAQDAPAKWSDLTNPKWNNTIAFGSPLLSGDMAEWANQMLKLYGWPYYTAMQKLNPFIGPSYVDGVTELESGERSIGVGLLAMAQRSASKGNPLGSLCPEEGCVVLILPTAILANAPHPNAARLFANFLLSPTVAKIEQDNGYTPIRTDFPGARPVQADAKGKLLLPSVDGLVASRKDLVTGWNGIFGG